MQLRILSPATRRLGLAMPFMLLMACSATRSYNDEFADVMNPYRNGQLKRAAKVMQESHSRDWRVKTNAVTLKMTYGDQAVLANLERGRLFFDAGMFSEAIEALALVATLTYRAVVNQDDDRCWKTLAADYQFVALPIPGNRKVRLRLSGGKAALAEAILPAGDAIFLVARSVNSSHISWHETGFPLNVRGVG